MFKTLMFLFPFIFQCYSQEVITIFYDDYIEMNYFARNSILLSSNELIRDTIDGRHPDGRYLFTEVCKKEYFNTIKNTPIRTISGQFQDRMKNGYFIQTEYFISKLSKNDTIIHTRQITEYKNGQRNGVDLFLRYTPIYERKVLVDYDISIHKLEVYEDDKQVGVSFEKRNNKLKRKNQIRVKSFLSISGITNIW
jgi:hypothetical protein